ncbi:MAG: transcription-repair coupling factor [bacterium]
MHAFQFFPDIEKIVEGLKSRNRVMVSGISGSPLILFIYELSKVVSPIGYITTNENLERYRSQLVEIIPALSIVDEKNPFYEPSRVMITTEDFFGEKIRLIETFELVKGKYIDREQFLSRLESSGFQREEIVEEEGEYAVRGGIIDIYPKDGYPVRIELDADAISSIRRFDVLTQRSVEVLEYCPLRLATIDSPVTVKEAMKGINLLILERELEWEQPQIILTPSGDYNYHFSLPRKYFGDLQALQNDIKQSDYTYKFLIHPSLNARLSSIAGLIEIIPIPIKEGFVDEDKRVVFLTENEIFGLLPRKRPRYKGLFIDDLKGLKIDDYVVHNDYGIGQFKGLVPIEFEGNRVECLHINYADGDKVYLPIERLNQLERYISSEGKPPRLSKLGSDIWLKTKERVKKATETLALELINLYARRQMSSGFAFSPDAQEMKELESNFIYEETPSQQVAIDDVKKDMESLRPQERLICGDVGFGKTEIAIRASFKAAMDGKQTMLLCPTTLLAFQHYNTFTQRLRNFPVRVEMVSRFKKAKELKEILSELRKGKIDIVIGTHRLLMPDVVFKDLGLLIIDEEQRFGVFQKEKFKKIKPGIDIIYLSATPIPRTLYMSLAGLKDISVINTPPTGRKDIITKIIHFDEEEIKKIICFERARNGQIFFVHNRIQTIETVRARLQKLLPELKICVLHGQMRSAVSEKKMLEFLEGKYDLLLSTAIVESGLDMPRVNTIIVNEAHRFGLADLHQLRGRVGRSDVQGYAYFIVPERRITEEAQKRLSALVSYTTLGSGFRLAIRDMEIRGIGNILGKEQSGYVNAIGYHHYVKILNNVINELMGKQIVFEPLLNLKIAGYFPAAYIPSAYERTAIYKRLMEVQSEYELERLKEEIIDRFGKYPLQVKNLFLVSKIRLEAINCNASEVVQRADSILFYQQGRLIRELSINTLV